MFAHRVLLFKKLNFASRTPLRCSLNPLNVTQEFSTSSFSSSSFKNISSEQINVSLFNIKKSLKLNNTQFEDGFTNLKTLCPACDPEQNGKSATIYINKTTGKNDHRLSRASNIQITLRSICLSKMPLRLKVRTDRQVFHYPEVSEDSLRA